MPGLMDSAPQFRSDYYEREGDRMRDLAHHGQRPQHLFVSCSDSRVVPELVMGAKPGDLFVLRNIGNIIPPPGTIDTGVGAVLEYGVRHLGVHEVILCGHLDCAAIRLLDVHLDMAREPYLVRCLEWARPAQTQVDAQNVEDPAERHARIVRANVVCQLANLVEYGAVREALRAGRLSVHGWVYDILTGQVWSYDASGGHSQLMK